MIQAVERLYKLRMLIGMAKTNIYDEAVNLERLGSYQDELLEIIQIVENPSTKFTAKMTDSEEDVTGYYCPHIFEGGTTHEPAIHVIGARNIESASEIELETLRPAEVE